MSLDVARAFAFHSYVTGDLEFLREKAWPILSGVADWIASRVTHSERGYEIRADMGIAERETEADNAAFTNMSAVLVLRDAISAAERSRSRRQTRMGSDCGCHRYSRGRWRGRLPRRLRTR